MIGTLLSVNHTPGEFSLPGERTGYRTRSGVIIGLRAPPRPQPVGRHAEIVQAVLLNPRPLRWDQMFVRALLKVTQ
jgi:hypothetical protein